MVDPPQVIGEPLPVLRNLILGQQGTTVKLTLQRREGGEVHQFETKLMRGTAEYFQSLSATRSMEDEIDQLRLQLRFDLQSPHPFPRAKTLPAPRAVAAISAPQARPLLKPPHPTPHTLVP